MKDYELISKLPIYAQEAEMLAEEIIEGKFGHDGDVFWSTKSLAENRKISIVTAHKVLNALCRKGVIELVGKKYRLRYEQIKNANEQKRRIIGIHVNNISNEYFSLIAKEAENYAKSHGYKLIICESNYEFEREKEILEMFEDIGVVGVLSCPGVGDNTKTLYENYPIPHVFIGRTPNGLNGVSVQVNTFPTAIQIANHFALNGYTNFAYAGISEIDLSEDLRLFGYKSGLFSMGYELRRENILSLHIRDIEQARTEIKDFLINIKKPVAILCYHDILAVEVHKACVELGLKVPDDVAIAGFDNLKISMCVIPEITTVDYRVENMVSSAFDHLLRQIHLGASEKINYYIEPNLIVRGSSGKNTDTPPSPERNSPLRL